MQSDPRAALVLPEQLDALFSDTRFVLPESRAHLLDLAFMNTQEDLVEIAYDVPGRGRVLEATVARCKHGAAVNFPEPYMRRRDPTAMVIADDAPTEYEHVVWEDEGERW